MEINVQDQNAFIVITTKFSATQAEYKTQNKSITQQATWHSG